VVEDGFVLEFLRSADFAISREDKAMAKIEEAEEAWEVVLFDIEGNRLARALRTNLKDAPGSMPSTSTPSRRATQRPSGLRPQQTSESHKVKNSTSSA
jgi:hypothetical protein